ncbi:hypothetical protein FV3_ORF16.5 [Frog virus 3]|uniref:Uncharacterized protein n=1 Tax=Frog virus 3 TaxID=10493 RepID=A0A2U7M3N4_FRG3V|nr:hypothetical protein FV3_ORF16.5 [Frog virus 3]
MRNLLKGSDRPAWAHAPTILLRFVMNVEALLDDISAWDGRRSPEASPKASPGDSLEDSPEDYPEGPQASARPKARRVSKRPVLELMPECVDIGVRTAVGRTYHTLWPQDRLRPTVEKQAVLLSLVIMAAPDTDVSALVKKMRVKGERLKECAREAERASGQLGKLPSPSDMSEQTGCPDLSAAASVLASADGRQECCWAQTVTCAGIAECCANHALPFRSVWKEAIERLSTRAPAALLRQEYGPAFTALCLPILGDAFREVTGCEPSEPRSDVEGWTREFAKAGHDLVPSAVQGIYIKSSKNILRRLVFEKYFAG